jgi:hypothetical protein
MPYKRLSPAGKASVPAGPENVVAGKLAALNGQFQGLTDVLYEPVGLPLIQLSLSILIVLYYVFMLYRVYIV